MNIEKQALGILLIVFLLVVPGFIGLIIPDRLDHIQKIVLFNLHIISAKKAETPLSTFDRMIHRFISLLYVAGCITLLLNCKFQAGRISKNDNPSWQLRTEGERYRSNTLDAIIRQHMEPFARDNRHSCVVVAVIADDMSNIYGFGRTDLKTGRPPDADTLFEIGSISKVFTGILLADFLSRNRSSIDTPIVSLLPHNPYPIDRSIKKITLRHLVTHTSGLPRMPDTTYSLSAMYKSITAKNMYSNYTDDIMLKTLAGGAGRHQPGETFNYSNYGFGLLGVILRDITGMSYQQMIEEVITRPLKMKDTAVRLNNDQHSRLATGYRCAVRVGSINVAQVADNWDMPDCMAGCGAIRSTGRDMLAFLAANMGRDDLHIFPTLKTTHQVMKESESRRLFVFKEKHKVGMGWMHDSLPKPGNDILWHNGATGGFTSFIGFSNDGRFGVVILNNSSNSVDLLGLKIILSLHEQL